MNYFNPNYYQQPINQPWNGITPQPGFQMPMQNQPSVQNQMPSMIPGRVVNDISEVTAQEVPMDGRISIFPKADYSCIYAKVWSSNGTIHTFEFVPKEATPTEQPIDIPQLINERFDKLESILSKGGVENE